MLVALAFQLLAGCAWISPASDPAPKQVAPDITAALSKLLAQRGASVRQRQAQRFLRTVESGPIRRSQKVWFDNLAQLPLVKFRQTFEGPLTETDSGYSAVVRTTTQLQGLDAVAIPTFSKMTFTASSRGWQVSDSHPVSGSGMGVRQPWDDRPIQVLRHGPVLLIVDQQTPDSQRMVRAVADVVGELHRTVPWQWPAGVLVEAPSSTEPLLRPGHLPGGAVDRVDGLTYRVQGGRTGRQFAASRLILHPRSHSMSNTALYRLLRHELTHVALGERNDRIPMWLSEGLAEYVAMAALPRAARTISAQARDQARTQVLQLPSDSAFHAQSTPTQYALSWHACQVVARLRGEAELWGLVDTMARRGTADADMILRESVGVDRHDLAAQAQALIRGNYR